MRKVKNKKVIRRLANKSFRSNQTRNMIADRKSTRLNSSH